MEYITIYARIFVGITIIKWFYFLIERGDFRGISAIIARAYMLIALFFSKSSEFLFLSCILSIFFDESLSWLISFVIPKVLMEKKHNAAK